MLGDAYNNRLRGIVERLSDNELVNEWEALESLSDVYLGENASERVLVDEICEAIKCVSDECTRRFCSKVKAESEA